VVKKKRAAQICIPLLLLASTAIDVATHPSWPGASQAPPSAALSDGDATDRALIERQTVCIASKHEPSGALADTLAYHYRRVGSRLHVGYFAHWSTERPWGYMPSAAALVTDAFYSHFLFVMPGVQRLLYGPADVEGATIAYDRAESSPLLPAFGIADDEYHAGVRLTSADLRDPHGRVILMTEAWSHQLGAKGAAQYVQANPVEMKCYSGASLVPMTAELADSYRLGSPEAPRRARPAWALETH
jgi:hypothetical protein